MLNTTCNEYAEECLLQVQVEFYKLRSGENIRLDSVDLQEWNFNKQGSP